MHNCNNEPNTDTSAVGSEKHSASAPNLRGGGSYSGTPPCNTVPANSIIDNNSPIKLLLHGIDTLYLTYQGQLSYFKQKELGTLKDLAKSEKLYEQSLAIYNINDHQFEVRPTGAGYYSFVIHNNAYSISFSSSNAKSFPLAKVQIRSGWLLKHGVEWVCQDLQPIIEHFGDVEDVPQVNRADLHADFVSMMPLEALYPAQWVSRALHIDNHTVARETTGFSIGRGGDITARLYDKTKEILKSKKEYMKAIWHEQGWEPDTTVWRNEFQYKRAFLIQRGVKTVPDLLEHLGTLWRYSMLSWLKLTIPSTTDSTQSRWPLHPVWAALADIEWTGASKPLSIPVQSMNPPTEQYMFVNGLTGYINYLVDNNSRHSDQLFSEYYKDVKEYHDRNSFHTGADFLRYVNEKAAIKAKKCNLPFPDIKEQSQQRIKDALKTDPKAYRKSKDGE